MIAKDIFYSAPKTADFGKKSAPWQLSTIFFNVLSRQYN